MNGVAKGKSQKASFIRSLVAAVVYSLFEERNYRRFKTSQTRDVQVVKNHALLLPVKK